MKKNTFYTMIILSALLVGFCGKKTNRVTADGSSTVYPITSAAAEEFGKQGNGVQVTVGISGTGGGFKKFCNNETDISNASRYVKEEEINACASKKIEFIELPIGYDGLSIVINKENDWAKELTVEDLKKIYQKEGYVKTWKELNPKWPDLEIKAFAPGQDSGTFDYFAEEIVKKKDNFRQQGVSFSEDDNTIVTGVAGNKGGIGFFGVAYYESNKDKLGLAKVVNPKTNEAVEPTFENVKSNKYAPLSRPIFIYVKAASASVESVDKFINFYLDNAAKFTKETGYIPFPDEIYAKVKKRYADKVKGTVVKSKEDKHKPIAELY
ncbi:MAG TPA: PstS family phosphate ABC transporter substrate-binding protein [Leptospiraceae bacterium]|nr:PstS family phosphate ABC transporter substrate-binding protein [Leptospiraceae bacterium]HMX34643.1 PstS family phosphate ABC transporter substrate-binding protein [Leptospiraceae bacterium]HMY34056.1 PstS family phosphate ABC transporter substrate-binding protein [Leptospiraceae bacterium]HMZ65723.1 PstS family phosphate ABC transporter substrate-binding protein [Leptospiraceae bacterium]HNA09272.1 PstS family phosphate ABC transporter substrate-binding protein [Leptospiraceae bacterium]